MLCRHCRARLSLPFLDLGSAPPSNAYLKPSDIDKPEAWLPLRLLVCQNCWLVQTEDFVSPEHLFSADYAYFSSTSASWLAHAQRFAAAATQRFGLDASSLVCEVAANDGYLLRNFVAARIPCYGIEPTRSTADAARAGGIDIVEDFLGTALASALVQQGRSADLIVGNNVLAHVPDINDFLQAIEILLKPDGVASFEFPHLLTMVAHRQFDTAYHEHYSYLSFSAATRILAANGLTAFDVERLPTHGGSLRVFAQRSRGAPHPSTPCVADLLAEEARAGVVGADFYAGFQQQAETIKDDLLTFLIEAKRSGRTVAAYGAAAKGNTLLNFAGVRPDSLSFVVDRAAAKQGCLMPGSRIPICDESRLAASRPDYILILPWNLRDELDAQLAYTRDWGARLVTAVPRLDIR